MTAHFSLWWLALHNHLMNEQLIQIFQALLSLFLMSQEIWTLDFRWQRVAILQILLLIARDLTCLLFWRNFHLIWAFFLIRSVRIFIFSWAFTGADVINITHFIKMWEIISGFPLPAKTCLMQYFALFLSFKSTCLNIHIEEQLMKDKSPSTKNGKLGFILYYSFITNHKISFSCNQYLFNHFILLQLLFLTETYFYQWHYLAVWVIL